MLCFQIKWNTDDHDVNNDVEQGVNGSVHQDINHVEQQSQSDSAGDEETVPTRRHCRCDQSSSSTCFTADDQRNIILSSTACQVTLQSTEGYF